jgi:two-component system, OmpR family, sensor histidine kinase KdpD
VCTPVPPRGRLRLYLGAAPGVGKTYAMLAEAQRRRARGSDVVAALVVTHGRRLTAAMAEGLETVPPRLVGYRGTTFTEMDLDAVLARRPQVTLVDELAHTNVPGGRHAKRWQDVEDLLNAGIDVISTLNIQHLESLSDVTRQITGVEQLEILPDDVARRADQIELVDMTPEALRRRMVHGNVYPPDRIEAALTHFFRPGNLTALRELALLWVADRVEEGLQRYRAEHGIAESWETRERIVVCVAGDPGDEPVIRRAARIAARTPGSDLLAVHVSPDDGVAGRQPGSLDRQRQMVASLGGSFQEVPGDDAADALLRFARAQNATQMVLGASRRGRIATLLTGKSTPTRVARLATHIDVHLVSATTGQHGSRPPVFRLLTVLQRRTRRQRAAAEAAALSRLAASVLGGYGDLPTLTEEIREMLGLDAVSLLERRQAGAGPPWCVLASAGDRAPDGPDATVSFPVTDRFLLAGRGHPLSRDQRRLLAGCAVPLLAGLVRRRHDEQDADAARLAADAHSRSALLAATGQQAHEHLQVAEHALAVLADPAAPLTAGDRTRLATDARSAVLCVSRLLNDLSDLRRLHAGALESCLRPVDLDEVVTAAMADLGPGAPEITVDVPQDLPDIIADADLLTRILTSLSAEALQRSPAGRPPALTASSHDGRTEIQITDHGTGTGTGTGDHESLGFRLARDLTESMGDTLTITETRDEGRIATLIVPAASCADSAGPAGPDDPSRNRR